MLLNVHSSIYALSARLSGLVLHTAGLKFGTSSLAVDATTQFSITCTLNCEASEYCQPFTSTVQDSNFTNAVAYQGMNILPVRKACKPMAVH